MLRRALLGILTALVATLGCLAPGVASRALAAEATPPDPLFPPDFPDPALVRVGSTTYAYATNGRFGNVQVIRSNDLRTWERLPDALPDLPLWAAPNFTWAPSVLPRGSGYVLYYTARHRSSGLQCVGRATGTRAEGPFVDELPQPFVCQMDLRGTIDPQPFVDVDGTATLLFKSEGRVGEPTRIWARGLSSDGRSLVGPIRQLAKTDQAWEEPIVEGPAMVRGGGAYWLLYAANRWETSSYALGYARCTTPLGPCVKDGQGPLLASSGAMSGPGSPDVVTAPDGSLLLTFHAWTTGKEGYPTGARSLRAVPLSFVAGKPAVPGSTRRVGDGYRLVASDGGIFAYGSAAFHGSTGDLVLNSPIRTMATTPSGKGYWLVASDGGVFTFGDAGFFGSTGSMKLNRPIIGLAATVTGQGYWLVASDGGIFSFGDAGYFGSTGDLVLNSPIVSIVSKPWSDGYWLVAADGGVFAFGSAEFLGSAGDLRLNSPIVGAAASPVGDGYWFAAADGGVFSFGRSGFFGSAGGSHLNRPIVGMAA